MSYRFFILLAIPLFIACGGEPKSANEDAAEPATVALDTFVTMTTAQARHLFEHANKVDVLFSNLPVSLSQVKKSDVQGQVSFMSPGPVPKNSGCTETANIIYQADGEIIGDGKMYIEGDCYYVVFYEDNQASYAAYMNEQGMKFYNQILSSRPQIPTE